MSGTWKTQDGRVLEIRWMDSAHLANTFNLIMRNNGLTKNSVEASAMSKIGTIANMMAELKARGLWEWRGVGLGLGIENQLVIPEREDFQTMCLQRAMIDTAMFWPSIVFWYAALKCLRHSFDTTWLSIGQALADPREHNRAKLERLVAKYTEYRLAPPAQWR